MNGAIRPLAIYPWPMSPEREALLRTAWNTLNLVHIRLQPAEAVPESPGRILAFGEIPPFYTDETVLIRPENVTNPTSILGALGFALQTMDTDPISEEGAITGEMWMRALLGPEVTYVGMEEYPPPSAEVLRARAERQNSVRFY